MSMSARIEKRDTADQAVEITTQSIFESFKGGVKNLFSDDNVKVSSNGHLPVIDSKLIWLSESLRHSWRRLE